MFALDKWYLDLVTDLGTVLVGYAVECRIGPARFRYASLLHASHDRPATERTTLRDVRFPALDGDVLRWNIPALRFEGAWERTAAPIGKTLLDAARGRIEWDCCVPRARVTARLDGAAVAGLGYAERLHLTCLPWQLPFSTLRWGRHVSESGGAVWIEWDGDLDRRWIWLDGREQPVALLDSDGITQCAGQGGLRLMDRRIVLDRQVLESVGRVLPAAIRDRFGPLAGMREQKWLSRSVLRRDDGIVDRGWTIHEEVRW
jgi:hypothetical protein